MKRRANEGTNERLGSIGGLEKLGAADRRRSALKCWESAKEYEATTTRSTRLYIVGGRDRCLP